MAVAVGLSLAGDFAVVVAQPERGRVAPAVLREPAVVLADVAAPVEAATKAQQPPMISKKATRASSMASPDEKGRSE